MKRANLKTGVFVVGCPGNKMTDFDPGHIQIEPIRKRCCT